MSRSLVPALATVALLAFASGAAADPPILSVPGDLTIEATGPEGAVVTFDASATKGTVACSPASGSTFPLGATAVTCTVADDDGDPPLSATFTVTVVDTTPPALVGTVAARAEANGPAGAPVSYAEPSATDLVDGPLPVSCAPASGASFSLGTTTVTCTSADAAGNVATSGGTVEVVDTTAPELTVPADAALRAPTASGLPATHADVQAFLAAATATDLVTASPVVTNDAPGVLPVGTTVVTFTATDAAGNATSKATAVTVVPPVSVPPPPGEPLPPPPPPQRPGVPPAAADRTPPANVSAVRVRNLSRAVLLTWRAPADADFAGVRIVRSRADEPAAAAVPVYEGARTSFRDRALVNGVQYRYVIVSADRAGNRSAGVAVSALPRAVLLRAPREGQQVVKPPLLVWARVARARFYNVQLYRGKTKVLSAWPKGTSLKLGTRWRYAGKQQRLAPGTYRWYVWPAFGTTADPRYGDALGTSAFRLVRKPAPKPRS